MKYTIVVVILILECNAKYKSIVLLVLNYNYYYYYTSDKYLQNIINSKKNRRDIIHMAALVFIAGSVCEQIYRVGSVFVNSYSVNQCWNYLVDFREELLNQRYLQQIDDRNKYNLQKSSKSVINLNYYNFGEPTMSNGDDFEVVEYGVCVAEEVDFSCIVKRFVFFLHYNSKI